MAVRPEASRSVLDSAGEPEDSGSDAHDSGLEQEAQSSEEVRWMLRQPQLSAHKTAHVIQLGMALCRIWTVTMKW